MTNERDIVERLELMASRWHECTSGFMGWLLFPEHYREAAAEITRLRSELEAEREASKILGVEVYEWREADLYGDMLGTLAGDYDGLDVPGSVHRDQVRTAKADTENNPLAAKAVEGARG